MVLAHAPSSALAPLLADPLPKTLPSSACKTPPSIDGVIDPGEWRDAKAIAFEQVSAENVPAAT